VITRARLHIKVVPVPGRLRDQIVSARAAVAFWRNDDSEWPADPTPFVLYNPSGDNSTVCMSFSVAPGQAKSVAVDNRPPPGGLARTIGF
jgi:hypothetical protein